MFSYIQAWRRPNWKQYCSHIYVILIRDMGTFNVLRKMKSYKYNRSERTNSQLFRFVFLTFDMQ